MAGKNVVGQASMMVGQHAGSRQVVRIDRNAVRAGESNNGLIRRLSILRGNL